MFQLVSREEYIVFLGQEGRRRDALKFLRILFVNPLSPPVATPHLLQRVFSRHLGHSIKAISKVTFI